eukprot:bmy_10555T0
MTNELEHFEPTEVKVAPSSPHFSHSVLANSQPSSFIAKPDPEGNLWEQAFCHKCHLLVICQMTNTKGKGRSTHYTFSGPFRKHGATPLATYMRIYKRGGMVDIKGMGTVQKGMPHKCPHGKSGIVYSVSQHAVGIAVNKQVKDKILSKRINVHIEHIKHFKRQGSFLKCVKENDQKEKGAKERVYQPANKPGPFRVSKYDGCVHVQAYAYGWQPCLSYELGITSKLLEVHFRPMSSIKSSLTAPAQFPLPSLTSSYTMMSNHPGNNTLSTHSLCEQKNFTEEWGPSSLRWVELGKSWVGAQCAATEAEARRELRMNPAA